MQAGTSSGSIESDSSKAQEDGTPRPKRKRTTVSEETDTEEILETEKTTTQSAGKVALSTKGKIQGKGKRAKVVEEDELESEDDMPQVARRTSKRTSQDKSVVVAENPPEKENIRQQKAASISDNNTDDHAAPISRRTRRAIDPITLPLLEGVKYEDLPVNTFIGKSGRNSIPGIETWNKASAFDHNKFELNDSQWQKECPNNIQAVEKDKIYARLEFWRSYREEERLMTGEESQREHPTLYRDIRNFEVHMNIDSSDCQTSFRYIRQAIMHHKIMKARDPLYDTVDLDEQAENRVFGPLGGVRNVSTLDVQRPHFKDYFNRLFAEHNIVVRETDDCAATRSTFSPAFLEYTYSMDTHAPCSVHSRVIFLIDLIVQCCAHCYNTLSH